MRLLSYLLLVLAIACCAFGQTYTINTVAGGGLPVNIPGNSASISAVGGVAADANGDVFMTLPEYDIVVRRGALGGNLTLVAGSGTAGFSGDNGPAINAQLSSPTGIAVDPAGNIVYVADAGNSVVRMISGGVITTVAGTGSSGYSGDNGPATSAQLWPVAGARNGFGLALDFIGNLYIADTGNFRIRKVANGVITTVAGVGTQGYAGDSGQSTGAQLFSPESVSIDNDLDIYIADGNRVREVVAGKITTVAGNTLPGSGGDNGLAINAQLNGPDSIAISPNGNLYIADTGNNRIREVSAEGVIATIAGTGVPGFSGDGGPATKAQLNEPVCIGLDADNDLLIADYTNGRVRLISNGVILSIAGGGTSIGDKNSATNGQLLNPQGVALDSAGDIFIADSGDNRARKVADFYIATLAGNGTGGFSGDSGPATGSELYNPGSVAVDSNGNIFIADSSNNRVREVSKGVITTIAGNGAPGFSGDNGQAIAAQLNNPSGVAVDANGNVYIADYSNNRVREVSSGVITTVAGNGTAGSTGDNGPAIGAELSNPNNVAVDAAGNLYIADSSNHRIRLVSGGAITTVAGGGASSPGNNVAATSARIGAPAGVTVDSSGNLYIADLDNNSIDRVTGGIITTITASGLAGYTGDGGPSLSAQLNAPAGLAVDASGNVYVADSGNQRIRALFPGSAGCTYAVSPSSFTAVTSAGGSLVATIQAPSNCNWAVQSIPPWIAYSGSTSGSGPATIALTASINSGAARSGIVSIAGVPVLVSQAGPTVTPPIETPSISPGGVVNDSSYTAPIAAGSIAAAYGDFLLTSPVTVTQPGLPTSISGLSLEFGSGTPVPLFYVSGTQVNFQVPWELAGQSQASLTATLNNETSAAQTVALAAFAPGIFAINGQGTGQGAILNWPSYAVTDSTNPAAAGTTYIMIYCTGLGAVTNQPADGAPAPSSPLSWTTTQPTVTIGGVQASVSFWGLAPGFEGLYQVNALVPGTSATGNAVPVAISIGGATSNTVTIAVQ